MSHDILFIIFFELAIFPDPCFSFRKVIVPAVYREWSIHGAPSWATNKTMMSEKGYEVFVYQKLDSRAPNFIATNRGSESKLIILYFKQTYY